MSARRPAPVSKKQRLATGPSKVAAALSTLPLPPPTFPIFSSDPPSSHTCYSAPPILFFPKPTAVPLPPRPASSRSSRLSPNTARSSTSSSASPIRPATARAAVQEPYSKPNNFTAADFHVPIAYRPATPRTHQHSAWTTATSSATSTCHTSHSAVSEDEGEADSSSVVESFISPFFLSHDANRKYRPAPHQTSTTHSTYRTVATLPSYQHETHRQRFLKDNAFEHSFNHIIGGSTTPATTNSADTQRYQRSSDVYAQTRRLYDDSSVSGEGRSHLPGGSDHLSGKWKPVQRNGISTDTALPD